MNARPIAGPSVRAGPFTLRRIDYPAGLTQPTHDHADAGITILLAGAIRETVGSTVETGAALSMVVKPAGVQHAIEVGPRGARTVQVVLHSTTAPTLGDAQSAVGQWSWQHGPRAAAPMLQLAGILQQEAPSPTAVEDGTIEVLAALGTHATRSRSVPDWLLRVKEALDDEIESDVAINELARRVGAHPVSVSRAFGRHFGETIGMYRRRERVLRAAARIGVSDEALGRIAHGGGYADHPHLCRDFRRVTGVTPSEFRRISG